MVLRIIVLISIMMITVSLYGASTDTNNILDYKTIKKILKNDMLDVELENKKKRASQRKRRAHRQKMSQYQIPSNDEYWSFFSEYWLVKNAQVLKWDFEKPDYGLKNAFESLLEQMGFYERTFKLLLINTSTVTHFGLPANNNEYIFVVSLPFIRTLDLSKLEISMLILEDMIRVDQQYFKDYLKNSKISKMLGESFYKKKLSKKDIAELLNLYDIKVFEKGFNFKEQFAVTQKMDKLLKSDLSRWNVFLNLKKKINMLIKTNTLYSSYAKIYPSPELQINWLSPKKKRK